MLNLEGTLSVLKNYNIQKDFYLRGFIYVFAVITFLDLLRTQVPEISLLQLIPGFYLLLLLFSFVFLLALSTFSFRIPFDLDNGKGRGTKTQIRMNSQNKLKFGVLLCLSIFAIASNSIIPLSFDSFDSYDEKTLTNIWSFDELIFLETLLLIILIVLSQVPVVITKFLTSEYEIKQLPLFWKSLSLFLFIFAGFITPTIDGYTQLSLSGSAISLYLIILNLIEKRISIKFIGSESLSF